MSLNIFMYLLIRWVVKVTSFLRLYRRLCYSKLSLYNIRLAAQYINIFLQKPTSSSVPATYRQKITFLYPLQVFPISRQNKGSLHPMLMLYCIQILYISIQSVYKCIEWEQMTGAKRTEPVYDSL